MKKTLSFVLLFVIITANLFSCINLTPSKKYTKVELSVTNYQNYLAYNIYTKNGKVERDRLYDGTAVGYITSWTTVLEFYPTKANCTFENVRICALGRYLPTSISSITLDGYGYATVQADVKRKNKYDSYIPSRPEYYVQIVTGYIYVYED